MKRILKDAYKSDELYQHLNDVIAVDDGIAPEDMSLDLILKEARYVLNKYIDGSEGFSHHEDYVGDAGPEAQKEAQKNVKALKFFLKKGEF